MESQIKLDLPGRALAAPTHATARNPAAAAPPSTGYQLGVRPLLGITGLFWTYAAVSAVLFVYGLSGSLAMLTEKMLFAPWPVRVLQYAVLYPPLVGCYWLSLRLGWQPLRTRAALQAALGAAFALLAYPALFLAETILGLADALAPGDERGPGLFSWLEPHLLQIWLAVFTDFLVRYGFGLTLVTGFAIYKRYRDLESRATAMERQWSEARLAALRMQLSPHTLFNLLHTIRGHIGWDPAAAQEMVVQLADLLRRLLNAGERDFTRLADELQFVKLYLDLQRRRFADRLTVVAPDQAAVPDAWVPSLILQPLVENAVAHGLAGHAAPVRVELAVAAEGEELRLRVTNTTAGGLAAAGEGIGLRNVRERLKVQFGERASLSAGPAAAGQWLAEIRMPLLRTTPPAGATDAPGGEP